MKARTVLLAFALPFVLGAAPAPLAKPMTLGFWVKEGRKPVHPALDKVEQGPCGPVAQLRIAAIPAFGPKDSLSSEAATELDGQGKVLRRWRLPVDYVVSSVDGDWLLTSYAGKADPVWIHVSGKLGKPAAAEAKLATNGEDGVMLVDSCAPGSVPDGAQCLSVRDLGTKTRRIIAAPSVCS